MKIKEDQNRTLTEQLSEVRIGILNERIKWTYRPTLHFLRNECLFFWVHGE